MARISRVRTWDGIALGVGSLLLVCWVFFRFSTKSINFDLVGQQLLARQWLEGNGEGAVVGPTNYIVKMVGLYMPAELLGIDPKLFLIVSTIVVNLATFIGMYVVLKRICGYFSVETGSIFVLSIVWLAAVAGSVFWVQFTNSRNLELLAGLTLLYIGLKLYRKPAFLDGILFVVLAGVVYFSDPLQLFVTSSVLVLYVCMHSFLFEKAKYKEPLTIVALMCGGYVLSQLIALTVRHVTGVEFIAINTTSQSLAVIGAIPTVVVETAKNSVRLVAGTNEMGIWRQVVNIVVVGVLAASSIAALIRDKAYTKHRSFVLFTAIMVAVPIVVYVASGQAVYKGDTSRYLIVLAPALIILFSLGDIKSVSARSRRIVIATLLPLLLVTSGSLLYAALPAQGRTVLRTAHLESRYAYLQERGHRYGYASMDTAIPAMYILGRGSGRVLLPLSCEGSLLKKSRLFYDKNMFLRYEKENGTVPIILDGNAITNHPHSCTVEVIKAQIGEPMLVDSHGGNTVLLYDSSQLRRVQF